MVDQVAVARLLAEKMRCSRVGHFDSGKARLAYAEHYDLVRLIWLLSDDCTKYQRHRVWARQLLVLEVYGNDARSCNLKRSSEGRLRRVNETLYNASLLPGGLIPEEQWRALYGRSDDEIAEQLEMTPYGSMIPLISSYGEQGGASNFSRERDILLYGHLSTGKEQLSGPERVLSYIMARELEIRNVKMVLSALANELVKKN